MRYYSMYNLVRAILIFLFPVIIFSQNENSNDFEKISNLTLRLDNGYNLELKFIQSFGGSSIDDQEIIGRINAFCVDNNENLYVADGSILKVLKFSKEGKLEKVYGRGGGKGPGEFTNISDVKVDSINNIYVLDKMNMRISAFDRDNTFLSLQKISFLAGKISVVSPMIIDVVGFGFTYKGELIYRYNLADQQNSFIERYVSRLNDKKTEEGMRIGNLNCMKRSKSGDLYFSYYYPYYLIKYSPEREPEWKITGKRKLPRPEYSGSRNNVKSSSGIDEMILFERENLVGLIVSINKNENRKYFLDFYEMNEGSYFGSVSLNELGIGFIRNIETDDNGNLYLERNDPYPHIQKYSFKLTKTE